MHPSLAALAWTIALQAQAQPQPAAQTAGGRYKSVQVLKDIPASQVIPSMAFIANSLGVTCSHCHTTEWESDEKPTKLRAREMLRMTQAINRDHYQGRAVVTCQTCHDGRVIPAAAPRVDDAGWMKKPPVAGAPLPSADEVLAAYVRAAGGEAALGALRTRQVAGTVTRFNGRTAPVSGPFQLFQQATSASLSTDLSHPPEADAEINASFARPLLTPKNYSDWKVEGRETIQGHEAIVLSGRNSRGATHRLFFDTATGLLVRRTSEYTTPLGTLPERFDLEGYRAIDGVMVPQSITWSRADYQVIFRLETVTHNVVPPK